MVKKNLLQISAKNLGQLSLPDYCPRCFYIKLKLGFKLPYQIFPGIFSSIDSYSKKITWRYYEKHNVVPPWFNSLGKVVKPIPVPHFSKFNFVDKKTQVKLTGVPDEIFLLENGTYIIIDYKIAKYTPNQDLLMPMYRVQLNGYALIFEKLGLGSISGLSLCYYEPQTEVGQGSIDSQVVEAGFNMKFNAHIEQVELDPGGTVMPLLKKVREIGSRETSPAGSKGCEECRKVGEMVGMV